MAEGAQAIAWGEIEGLPGDQVEGGHDSGLGPVVELPSAVVYEAGLALESVLREDVPLEAVVPVTRLQTRGEIARWETKEAARKQRAAKRGVHLGKDPRDLKPAAEAPATDESVTGLSDIELVEAPFARGMGMRPTAEERAKADAVLREHSRRIHSGDKKHYL